MGKNHKNARQQVRLVLREMADEVYYLRNEALDDARRSYSLGSLAEFDGQYETAIANYKAAFLAAKAIQEAGEKAFGRYNDIADTVEAILSNSQLNIMNLQTSVLIPVYFGLIGKPVDDR